MPDLTDADYDALFAVIQADMPRIWREIFPKSWRNWKDRRSHPQGDGH